jgi:tetratricopeptide (TPR) repeat protein
MAGLVEGLTKQESNMRAGTQLYCEFGECLEESGDVAIAACTRGINLGVFSGQQLLLLYSGRGHAYNAKGDYDRAIDDFSEAIRLDPKDSASFNGRCWARATTGRDLEQALTDCNVSLRLKPNNADTLDSRGLVYLRLNRLADAIADYNAALKINSRQAPSLYGRGIAKLLKGDTAAGHVDIAAAKAVRENIAEEFAKYGIKPDAAPAVPAPSPSVSAPAANCARAETHWKSVEEIRTLAAYEDHLVRFPSCEFATLAKARIEALKK